MSEKESPSNVIESYRKRQQSAKRAPLMLGISAALLILGAAVLIFWLLGPEKIPFSLFPTPTYTPTETFTPTSTATETPLPTETPTITLTPTETPTVTASGPFAYTIVEGDTLSGIAEKYNVDLLLLVAINNLDSNNPIIRIGDQLTIPGPDTQMPTVTPLPPNLGRGTKIDYVVQAGDTLAIIAEKFNSTIEALLKENEIADPNTLFVGQKIVVPVNLVTPVPTSPPTPTYLPTKTGGSVPTEAITVTP